MSINTLYIVAMHIVQDLESFSSICEACRFTKTLFLTTFQTEWNSFQGATEEGLPS